MIINDWKELFHKCQDLPGTIVTTNGCFDILHAGHIDFLQRAKDLGDVLIVGINSDASVRRLKGEGRPYIHELWRCRTVDALDCVDIVTVFDSSLPIPFIQQVQPNIHVKGGDYASKDLPERETVEKYGVMKLLPFHYDISTSELMGKGRTCLQCNGTKHVIVENYWGMYHTVPCRKCGEKGK